MIKYTILYKNGKAWNGKCKHMDDLQAQFVANDVLHITVTTQTSVHVLWPKRTWFDNVSVEQTVLDRHNGKFKLPRKPNPASVTKKQKAFDKAYAEWKINNSNLVDYDDDGSGYMKYAHVGNGDTSIKAYKKWLWEQKQATPDGWITWHGGECPVPKGTMVHVKFRCGEEAICTAGLSGHDEGFKEAIDSDWVAVDWSVDEVENDIVAYKLFGKPVAEFHKQVEELQEHLRGGIPVDKAFALCTQRTRDELGWSKQPIKTTYTFWLGAFGEVD